MRVCVCDTLEWEGHEDEEEEGNLWSGKGDGKRTSRVIGGGWQGGSARRKTEKDGHATASHLFANPPV